MPEVAFERVPWYATRSLHVGLLGGGLLLYLGLVIAAVARLATRRPLAGPDLLRRARMLLLGAAIAELGFAVGLALVVGDFWSLVSGHLTGIVVALALPVVGSLLVAGAAVLVALLWTRRVGPLGSRAWLTAQVVISLGFLWSLDYWNLLGWRL
jgi:hypothetical protein